MLVQQLMGKLLQFLGFQKIREIAIEQPVIDDLRLMAAEAHPKEMLAFLSASKGTLGGSVVIDEIQLQAYNASEDHASFNLWQLPAVSNIVGTVHSHPSDSNEPSGADLRLFGQYGFVHAIIKEPYNQKDIAFYDKDGNGLPVKIRT